MVVGVCVDMVDAKFRDDRDVCCNCWVDVAGSVDVVRFI